MHFPVVSGGIVLKIVTNKEIVFTIIIIGVIKSLYRGYDKILS